MAEKETAIKVEHLTKSFRIPLEASNGIKQKVINVLKGRKGYREFTPLDNLSFEIKKGDFFGIVGRNGSGKSTLLKTIAGIYSPTKGSVQLNGSLVPFIELGVGFNPELTGRENVFLNGALLGFSHDEMEKMYGDIVEFAELDDFMDERLKNYSSGMQVRLAFSIAIRAQGDILLLDEVLAVGDEAFQRKCNRFFSDIKKDKSKTVVLVTHDMNSVRKYCNKAIMIQDGALKLAGSPENVANEYSLDNLKPIASTENIEKDSQDEGGPLVGRFEVTMLNGRQIFQGEKVVVKYTYKLNKKIKAKVVMDLWNIDENYYVYCYESPLKKIDAGKKATITVSFNIAFLNNMNLVVHSSLRDENGDVIVYANDTDSPSVMIRRTDYEANKPQAGAIFIDGINAKWQ